MTISGIPRFQRFFRTAAGLHVDKDDLKRYTEFVNRKVYDLLLMAEATAEANRRDVVQPEDLPITKGLQQSIHEFEKLEIESEMLSIIEQLEVPVIDGVAVGGDRRRVGDAGAASVLPEGGVFAAEGDRLGGL